MIIKIFVVTKNEYDLIEDWVKFYGNIFGYENLTIIDTGSDNKIVLDFYEKLKINGKVNLIIDYGYEGDSQGDKFSKYMNIEKEKNSCDFLLGCDTDNFLFIKDKNKIVKEDYFNFFKSLPKDKNKFLIHYSLDSLVEKNPNYKDNKYIIPTKCNSFIISASVCINFYRTQSFISTSNGNHQGVTEPDEKPLLTNLGMYHFNNTGILRHEERAIEICKGYKFFEYLPPININNCKNNYKNFEDFFLKNLCYSGIHRIIQAYSFILRRYVFFLFNEYADESFMTIDNFYKVLYSNKNILKNINNITNDNNYYEEILLSISGNVKFVNERTKYNCNDMENDFKLFFKNKKVSNKKLHFTDILNFDEFCEKKKNIIEDNKLLSFLEKNNNI